MDRIGESPLGWVHHDETEWTLRDIREHYGSAYRLNRRGDDWEAERKDGKGTLRATRSGDLVALIRIDMRDNPVPRSGT